MIQVVAWQYGPILRDENILNMTCEQNSMWLKRNPVTVARHFNHCINTIFVNKVILSGLHPVGKKLDVDCRSEFQDRANEHLHAAIHVVDGLKIDVDDDEKVTELIDKYITCSILNRGIYSDLNKLVKSVQTNQHNVKRLKVQGVD